MNPVACSSQQLCMWINGNPLEFICASALGVTLHGELESCSYATSDFCEPLMECVSASKDDPLVCRRYCCSDADCTTGTCQPSTGNTKHCR